MEKASGAASTEMPTKEARIAVVMEEARGGAVYGDADEGGEGAMVMEEASVAALWRRGSTLFPNFSQHTKTHNA